MKKKLMVFALLAMVVLSGVTVLSAAECEQLTGSKGVGLSCGAGGGVWAQVCCGVGCSPGDYCVGSGTYVCCK